MTVTLLVVSMTYLMLTSPFYIVDTIFESQLNPVDLTLIRNGLFVLILLNHSIDFVLYAVANREFRRNFAILFIKVGELIINIFIAIFSIKISENRTPKLFNMNTNI